MFEWFGAAASHPRSSLLLSFVAKAIHMSKESQDKTSFSKPDEKTVHDKQDSNQNPVAGPDDKTLDSDPSVEMSGSVDLKNQPKKPAPAPSVHQAITDVDLGNHGTPPDDVAQLELEQMVPRRPRTVDDFLHTAVSSGLISVDEFNEFLDKLPSHERPTDADEAAEQFVAHKRLTPYQADMLVLGKTRGLVMGTYEILEKIGEGGMGVVFRAKHNRMKRIVAVKILPPSISQNVDSIRRFHREVEVAGKLDHPNIAAAYDANEADGIHFLVMEYIDGPNLSTYVRQAGPLPIAVAAHLITQTARGLAYAHDQGIVHRDIKPGNLLLTSQGVLKIMDMGLAVPSLEPSSGNQSDITNSGRVMGTVDYMAPEQAVNAKNVDQRADIYSLGCTLYYLLTGHAPAPEGTITQKLLWHQNEEMPDLRTKAPGIPDSLAKVFHQMVAKAPGRRQQTMSVVVEQLEACLEEMQPSSGDLVLGGISLHSGVAPTDQGVHQAITIVDRRTATDIHEWSQEPRKRSFLFIALSLGILFAIGALIYGSYFASEDPIANTDVPVRPSVNLREIQITSVPGDAKVSVDGVFVWRTPVEEGQSRSYELPDDDEHKIEVTREGYEPMTKEIRAGDIRELKFALVALPPVPDDPPEPAPNSVADNNSQGENQVDPDTSSNTDGNVNPLGSDNTPPDDIHENVPHPPPSPSIRPHEELITWIFENKGSVILRTGKQTERFADRFEDVPFSYEVIGVSFRDVELPDYQFERLSALRNLQQLVLQGTTISNDDLEQVCELADLRVLDISATKVTNDGLTHLNRMLKLEVLLLNHNNITAQGLANLPKDASLRRLDLSDTPITDSAWLNLSRITTLREVTLCGTNFTIRGHRSLRGEKSNLDIIWDGENYERNVALVLLQRGANLLVRGDNQDQLREVKRKSALPNGRFFIREIQVSSSEFRDRDVELLTQLTEVSRLHLGGSGVTRHGLEALYPLSSLRQLHLGKLRLSEQELGKLKAALPDCEVLFDPSPDFLAAQWVLSHGGVLEIVPKSGNADQQRIESQEQLPPGGANGPAPYYIKKVNLDGLGNQITNDDLARLIELKGLTDLSLRNTWIGSTALNYIGECTKLATLDLTGTKVKSDGIGALRSLQGLKTLHLPPDAVDHEGIRDLSELTGLLNLSLSGAELKKNGAVSALAKISWLQSLDLSGSDVDDTAVRDLRSLRNLQVLTLFETNITTNGVQRIQSILTKCDVRH